MHYIYVIGAQCTGKTTLVEAISKWLRHNKPHASLTTIRETARTILQLHNFTRDDVKKGGERCMQLQKLIFDRQIEVEGSCEDYDMVIFDRSAVDPVVYGRIYVGEDAVRDMLQSQKWTELKSRMKTATVIVCEPVEEWLFDDGVRLIPENRREWLTMHTAFCEILQQHQIPYIVLAASLLRLDERVEFVLARAGIIEGSI